VRSIAYFLAALIAIVAIGFTIAGIVSAPSFWRKLHRKHLAELIPPINNADQMKKRQALEAIYIEHDLAGLMKVHNLLTHEDRMKQNIMRVMHTYPIEGSGVPPQHLLSRTTLGPLIDADLVSLEKDELKIDPDLKAILQTYLEQIKALR
jgi:hypothetical protein